MSYAALCPAVKTALTNQLMGNPIIVTTNGRDMGIDLSPNPPAWWGGDLYLAISPGPITPGRSDILNAAIDEQYTIRITLTQRVSQYPDDRRDETTILKATDSIDYLSRLVRKIMYEQRHNIQDFANNAVQADPPFGKYCQFVEPLLFAGATEIAYTPQGWFHEDLDNQRDAYNPSEDGVFTTLTFDRCRAMRADTVNVVTF